VQVHHTGRVTWWFGGVTQTSCDVDGTLFPFDSQFCSIIIQSWAYSEAFVDLRQASNFIHLDGFNDDGEINAVSVFSFVYFCEVVAYYECHSPHRRLCAVLRITRLSAHAVADPGEGRYRGDRPP